MSENNTNHKSKSDSSLLDKDLSKTSDENRTEDTVESDLIESKKSIVKNSLNESKENKSKYRKVESRYQQSTKAWIHKRNDDSLQNKSKDSFTTTASTSNSGRPREPTPNSKTRSIKASTPVSTNKSLNYSGVSAITDSNGLPNTERLKTDANKCLNKYGKALTGRQSGIFKRELYPSLKSEEGLGSSRGPMALLPSGQDKDSKNKEMRKSIDRSRYLQSVLLNLKAKQVKKQRDSDAMLKITQIWNINNEMRLELQATQHSVNSLEMMIQSIEHLESQKQFLEQYLKVREQLDPIYDSFADLINKQKLLIKLENCDESNFEKLNDLLNSLPDIKQKASFEKLSLVALKMDEMRHISSDIESLKIKCNQYNGEFERFIERTQQLENTEKYLNNNHN